MSLARLQKVTKDLSGKLQRKLSNNRFSNLDSKSKGNFGIYITIYCLYLEAVNKVPYLILLYLGELTEKFELQKYLVSLSPMH